MNQYQHGQVYKLIVNKGLPEHFVDGNRTTIFNPEKIFQDLYLLGKVADEFNGKIASELTDQALALIATHKQKNLISRSAVHNTISDLLILSGFPVAAHQVEQRHRLQA